MKKKTYKSHILANDIDFKSIYYFLLLYYFLLFFISIFFSLHFSLNFVGTKHNLNFFLVKRMHGLYGRCNCIPCVALWRDRGRLVHTLDL